MADEYTHAGLNFKLEGIITRNYIEELRTCETYDALQKKDRWIVQYQSKTSSGNEKERLRVLIPFAQFQSHDKTTEQSKVAEVL